MSVQLSLNLLAVTVKSWSFILVVRYRNVDRFCVGNSLLFTFLLVCQTSRHGAGPVALALDILFDFTPCDVLCQRSGQKCPAALEGLCWSNVSSVTALWL